MGTTAQWASMWAHRAVKPGYVAVRSWLGESVFERRYGIRTAGRVELDALGLAGPERMHYLPAGWLSLRRILPAREVDGSDVFMDFGSGMGRVVVMAAMYPFRRVVGVELAPDLHRIAVENVEGNRCRLRCRDVSLVCADALDHPVPPDLTVAFFYNPFHGATFATVIGRLLESLDAHPRRLRVVYGNPVEHDALMATGRFRVVRTVRGMRPGRDWSRSNSWRLYEAVPR